MLRYPHVAAVSCDRCQKILHDDNWQPVTRGGEEMPRPATVPPNCRGCPKIPLSVRNGNGDCGPEQAVQLSKKNHAAYMYYMEVQAGATMSEDPMTRRICACIRRVETSVANEKSERSDMVPLILSLLVQR